MAVEEEEEEEEEARGNQADHRGARTNKRTYQEGGGEIEIVWWAPLPLPLLFRWLLIMALAPTPAPTCVGSAGRDFCRGRGSGGT